MPDQFSKTVPQCLQAWDATALRRYQECPRKHQLQQLDCWEGAGDRIHIEFGKAYHEYVEMFDKFLLQDVARDDATRRTLLAALSDGTLRDKLRTSYLPSWRCLSPSQAIITRGPNKGNLGPNRKQCARSKAAQFDGGHRDGQPCPDCACATVDDWSMICEFKGKNRDTLLRTLWHYCDTADDRVRPYAFPDGTPAVELSFCLPLPIDNPDGDAYLLTGNIDSFVEIGDSGEVLPRERKTTKNDPEGWTWNGGRFFDKYDPDVQIDTYDLAVDTLFAELFDVRPSGVMVEVTQVTEKLSKIARHVVNVPEERREETLNDICAWIKKAEADARAGYFPKNTAACESHGGCPFRDVCRRAPSSRKHSLATGKFVKREMWNTLQIR